MIQDNQLLFPIISFPIFKAALPNYKTNNAKNEETT